jgi:hypothetical protein
VVATPIVMVFPYNEAVANAAHKKIRQPPRENHHLLQVPGTTRGQLPLHQVLLLSVLLAGN